MQMKMRFLDIVGVPWQNFRSLRPIPAHKEKNGAQSQGENIQRTQNVGHVVVDVQWQIRINDVEPQILLEGENILDCFRNMARYNILFFYKQISYSRFLLKNKTKQYNVEIVSSKSRPKTEAI
jgi:hypothetical protein